MISSIAAIMLAYAAGQRSRPKQPLPMALGAWSLPELLGEIAARDATIARQQREIEELRERVQGQGQLLAKTEQALLELRAKLAHARQEIFGASRERPSQWQLDIFDQAHEAPLPPEAPDISIPVEGRRRCGRGKGRPALPADLPVERVMHAMPPGTLQLETLWRGRIGIATDAALTRYGFGDAALKRDVAHHTQRNNEQSKYRRGRTQDLRDDSGLRRTTAV